MKYLDMSDLELRKWVKENKEYIDRFVDDRLTGNCLVETKAFFTKSKDITLFRILKEFGVEEENLIERKLSRVEHYTGFLVSDSVIIKVHFYEKNGELVRNVYPIEVIENNNETKVQVKALMEELESQFSGMLKNRELIEHTFISKYNDTIRLLKVLN